MSLNLAWDPLFRLPLATALVLAATLPLIGAGLRLREQWFSSLGVAQMAAAGGVAGALLHGPIMLFALLGAALGGAARALAGRTRNEHYAVLLLAGWAAVILLALQGHHADTTALQLLNGQLYFTALPHLLGAIALLGALLACGRWLARRLLLARLFPDHFAANGRPTWPHELCFEGLLIAAVVLGISTMGVMATFAMMFLPPWVAFRLARGWPRALLLSALIGLVACLAGFMLALALDLPFGAALVAVLLLSVPLRLAPVRFGRQAD
ncbi:MAG TPA: metal ABC transporter permease [Gammaproteobacteria bacterium]|nr:metal ABC transporter permease [Gammaproteobacteria bacterium]HRP86013.1 metal ABC transporter permease [Gammaproteobacteria bacterium]